MKCITLWQPWASWVALGWKPIETRTHTRFAGLVGQRIAIHAGLKWDEKAIEAAFPWLADWQIEKTEQFRQIKGVIICTAYVERHVELTRQDSRAAKIDCAHTGRYGLFLFDLEVLPEPIPMRGRQGIWNVDLEEAGK